MIRKYLNHATWANHYDLPNQKHPFPFNVVLLVHITQVLDNVINQHEDFYQSIFLSGKGFNVHTSTCGQRSLDASKSKNVSSSLNKLSFYFSFQMSLKLSSLNTLANLLEHYT